MVFLGLVFSIVATFWRQIFSGFEYVIGDGYDGVVENVLVTHWWWVIKGDRIWNEVGYFYPHENTLGYNDSYLLYGIISSVYRLFIDTQFIAVEFAHITVKVIGYLSVYNLSRYLKLSVRWAIFAAILFTVAINTTNMGHAQLLTIGVAPLYYLLLVRSLFEFKFLVYLKYALLAALVYGLMMMNSYYIGYFSTLYLVIFTAITAVLNFKECEVFLKNNLRRIAGLGLFHLLAIIPFLVTYLPKVKETGGHGSQEVEQYMPRILDLINIGEGSLLWSQKIGWLAEVFNFQLRGGEFTHGIGLLLISVVIVFGWRSLGRLSDNKIWRLISTTTCVLVLISVNKNLWMLLYQYLPGTNGLRVVSRINVFLMLPFSLMAAQIFQSFENKAGLYWRILCITLPALVVMEQLNTNTYVHVNVKENMQMLEALPDMSGKCRAFYLTNPIGFKSGNEQIDNIYRANVQAMLISSGTNIPTIIGFSSFNPKGWVSVPPTDLNYQHSIAAYTIRNDVVKDLCELNVSESTVEEKRFIVKEYFNNSFDINFMGENYYLSGFNQHEDWGVWTSAAKAIILLDKNFNKDVNFEIRGLRGFGPNVGKVMRFGCDDEWVEFILKSQPENVGGKLSAQKCINHLEIIAPNTYVPALVFPESKDFRSIGVGLKEIRFII